MIHKKLWEDNLLIVSHDDYGEPFLLKLNFLEKSSQKLVDSHFPLCFQSFIMSYNIVILYVYVFFLFSCNLSPITEKI